MPNALTFTLEIKAAPELMGVLTSLITIFQPQILAQVATPPTSAPAAAPQQQSTAPVPQQAATPAQPPQFPAPGPQALSTPPIQYSMPAAQPPQYPAQQPPTPQAPVQTAPPAYTYPATPVAPPAMPQAPTAQTPSFTYDDLARAASSLMDAGKQQQLIGLLGQFQIQRLDLLPKEQYGAFATALRQMGARI